MKEYSKEKNMLQLDEERQKFVAKSIVRDVQRIAREHGISEEQAYWGYTKGIYEVGKLKKE